MDVPAQQPKVREAKYRDQQIFYTPTAQKRANRIKDLFTGGVFTKTYESEHTV